MSKPITPIKAIRLHCIDCQGGNFKLPRFCDQPDCLFYPWRMGKNPKRQNMGGNPKLKS